MAGKGAPPPDPPKIPSIFEAADRVTILGLAALLIVSAGLFYWFVGAQGLLAYQPAPNAPEADNVVGKGYFLAALDYREKRLALALTYRTFITTLGFTVGLVLCAIGGIFVLRRATAELTVTAELEGVPAVADRSKWFLATSSPGIVFALLGTGVMALTHVTAISVGAPEIYPNNANPVCPSEQREAGTCFIASDPTETAALPPDPEALRRQEAEAYCAATEDPACADIEEIIRILEANR